MAGKRALPIGYAMGSRTLKNGRVVGNYKEALARRKTELHAERVTGAAVLAGPMAMLNAIQGFSTRAAPEIARELERILDENIKAERGPDGKPWPKKRDGGKALQGTVGALKVQIIGSSVVATLGGIEARHNLGFVRGTRALLGNKRQTLPSLRVPGALAQAIQRVVDAEAARVVQGDS